MGRARGASYKYTLSSGGIFAVVPLRTLSATRPDLRYLYRTETYRHPGDSCPAQSGGMLPPGARQVQRSASDSETGLDYKRATFRATAP
jgi:hypothetical protein